MKHRV